MSEYIAASVPLHCLNGWTYLGHAVEAALGGDEESAIHLAYYAELRAALCFLASRGVGIFNSKHVAVDTAGTCHAFNGSTHIEAWHSLDEWASRPSSGTDLLNLFAVRQRSFTDWIQAANAAARGTIAALGRSWLSAWSLDLNTLKTAPDDDRTIRNLVSYRPQHIPTPIRATQIAEMLDNVTSIWAVLEPDEVDRFRVVDRHLLRTALESVYTATTGVVASGNAYNAYIDQTLGNLGFSSDQRLADFLKRSSEPTDHLILQQAKRSGLAHPRALPVIARAVLLLRIASASTEELLRDSGIGSAHLQFWWRPLAEDSGILDSNADDPDAMTDLWADIAPEVDDARAWSQQHQANSSLATASRDIPRQLLELARFGRAGLWAIGL